MREEAAKTGELPVEYMLRIMRDENESPGVRMDMAKAAAPYVHPKLSSVEQKTRPYDLSKLTDAELAELGRLTRIIEGVDDAPSATGPRGGGTLN